MKMRLPIVICALILLMSACAKVEKTTIMIDTVPQGAEISIAEKENKTGEIVKKDIGISPVEFELIPQKMYDDDTSDFGEENFSKSKSRSINTSEPRYTIFASKDGYFAEKQSIYDFDDLLKTGTFEVQLEKSPLWWATTTSSATNQWINLIVSSEISDVDMWQRVVDAVTKRFPELNKYDFTSGYLMSTPKEKIFKTSRGSFILRSKFVATVMERDPLTYRLKLVSEWSNREGAKWHPYPRVFHEDAALVSELMNRFQAY